MWWLILVPIITGGGLAAQSAVNAKLRQVVASPYLSSFISFFTGWLILLLAMVVTRQPFIIHGSAITNNPWWIWTGGILGLIGLTSLIFLFPVLGSVQTSVLTIFDQVLMGVLVDQFGWLYSPQKPLTWRRGIGIVFLVIGVLLANYQLSSKISQEAGEPKVAHRLWWQIYAVVTGMVMALQSTVNGHFGTVLHSSLYAVTISFTLSLILLIIGLLVGHTPWQNVRRVGPAVRHQWWVISGGFLGVLYSFSCAWLVPILGTGEVVVFSLFGQLVFSSMIDQWGLLGADQKSVTRQKLWGLFLLLIGVVLISW